MNNNANKKFSRAKNRCCKRIIGVFFLSLLLFSYSQAQNTLTLQQCITDAIAQSFDVKILQNEESVAKNNAIRGNAGYYPEITGNLSAGGNVLQWEKSTNSEQYGANIAAAWTVFDGNKRPATYAWLQDLKEKATLSTRLTVETLVAEVVTLYYDLVQRDIRTQNLKETIKLSRLRLRIAQEKFLLGACSRLEVLQAEVDFNADSSAYEIYMEGTLQLKLKLKQHLRYPYDQDIFVADSSITLRENLESDDLRSKALSQNVGLQIYSKNRSLSDWERKQIEAARYPYIQLKGAYGYSGATPNTNELGLTYGITLGMKIYDGSNQRRMERNAALQQKNRELEYQQQEQQVLTDLHLLYSSYRIYLQLLQLETHNSTLAEEKVELALEQYRQGQLSSLEMREFQRTLLDAQNRFVTALFQAKYAEINLLHLCAMISEYSVENSATASATSDEVAL